jgi:hypothetical protein
MGRTRRRLNKEYLINKMQEAAEIFGPYVTLRDMSTLKGFPAKSTFRKFFGGFNSAKIEAGLQANNNSFGPHSRFGIQGKIFKPRQPCLRLRFQVLQRDNFKCQYCGRGIENGIKLVVDHINPRSKGGLATLDNLVTSCFECNMGKRDYLLDLHEQRTVLKIAKTK